MKFLCFLFILFSPFLTLAGECRSDDQAQTECCEFRKAMNLTRANRIQTFDKSICTLGIHNLETDTSFRRFGFASDGQVSVFMQPGGNKSKSNSLQSFLIFPFGENPTVKFETGERIKVSSGSGQSWTLNSQSSLPIALEGCKLQVNGNFSLQNSGVKIQSCQKHLVIETPVEVGGEYIAYPEKPLTIKDPKGTSCQIKNSDLYEYKKDGKSYKDKLGRYYSIKMKFKTNRQMGESLHKLCPDLDVSMLISYNAAKSKITDPDEEKRVQDLLEGRK